MANYNWTLIITAGVAVWAICGALDRIANKLDTLIDLVHRIRINDRDRDF